jgi:hypothetical protein
MEKNGVKGESDRERRFGPLAGRSLAFPMLGTCPFRFYAVGLGSRMRATFAGRVPTT